MIISTIALVLVLVLGILISLLVWVIAAIVESISWIILIGIVYLIFLPFKLFIRLLQTLFNRGEGK